MTKISPVNLSFSQNIRQSNTEAETKQKNTVAQTASEKFSLEASSALKTQALYKKSDLKDNVYLADNLSTKEIIAELKNKEKMGRSFFGYKKSIAEIINKAEDKNLATANFNKLLNAKEGKLKAADIRDILLVSTSINNGKLDEKLAKEYGFQGGKLEDATINRILEKFIKQREEQAGLYAFMQQQMMNQQMMQQQMMNQQMIDQQMMHQQMIDQQMMQQQMLNQQMITPGFGF